MFQRVEKKKRHCLTSLVLWPFEAHLNFGSPSTKFLSGKQRGPHFPDSRGTLPACSEILCSISHHAGWEDNPHDCSGIYFPCRLLAGHPSSMR